MKVIKEWGRDLKWWRRQTVDDRAMMMAYEIYMSTVSQYRDEWMDKKRKDKRDGESHNPYKAMLRKFGLPEI